MAAVCQAADNAQKEDIAQAREALDQYGARLFSALVNAGPELARKLRSLNPRSVITLEFEDEPAELLQQPWEFLLDGNTRIAAKHSLVRRIGAQCETEPVAGRPFRLLVVISEPLDTPEFHGRDVYAALLETLQPFVEAGLLDLTFIRVPATPDSFSSLLTERDFDGVHFFGHGKTGGLWFEGENGEAKLVKADGLGTLLAGSRVKLFILSACRSGADGELDPLAGTAQSLVKAGVPCVVAMQFVAQVKAANLFVSDLCKSMFGERHTGLAEAVRASRTNRYFSADDAAPDVYQWGVPVLYLQSETDVLLAGDGTGKPAGLNRWPDNPPGAIKLDDKPLLGRGEMMVDVNRALAESRVVVLEGEGGIGKTALARHVAVGQAERNKCPGGAAFVSFDPPISRDLAIDAIGTALIGDEFSKAQGNHLDVLKQHFTRRPGLVVLDNLENVGKDSGILQLVNGLSPTARILITTREQIGMGRTVIVKALDDSFAAVLFVKRALDAGWDGTGDRGTLKAIGSELGNMPLAIELVAPQAATMALTTVLERVRKDLASVAADNPTLPKRQRSIVVSPNLSHDPLPEPARILFRRMSVLAAGATGFMLPEVREVKDWENPVAELVRRRLVRFEGNRYTMLPPIRRYAQDKLATAGETEGADGHSQPSSATSSSLRLQSSLPSADGRRVTSLRPGANDISALAPGVYSLRQASSVMRRAPIITKAVATEPRVSNG